MWKLSRLGHWLHVDLQELVTLIMPLKSTGSTTMSKQNLHVKLYVSCPYAGTCEQYHSEKLEETESQTDAKVY